MVALAEILTSAELVRYVRGLSIRRDLGTPPSEPSTPELAPAVRAAWAVAVGHNGSGPGALAVIRALTRALRVAELLRRQGAEPRRAIAVPLRFGDLPPGSRPSCGTPGPSRWASMSRAR